MTPLRCILLALLFPVLAGAAPKATVTSETAPSAAPTAAPVPSSSDSKRILSAGDTVSLAILEDKTPAVSSRISDMGEVDVQPVGRVKIAGKTCEAAAAQIKKLLEQDYYYKATVRLDIDSLKPVVPSNSLPAKPDTGRVFVSGNVKAPGQQEFLKTDRLTVSAAVLRAGPDQFANKATVKITRKNKDGSNESFTINVEEILKKGMIDKDLEVRDGDYIFVPKKFINI